MYQGEPKFFVSEILSRWVVFLWCDIKNSTAKISARFTNILTQHTSIGNNKHEENHPISVIFTCFSTFTKQETKKNEQKLLLETFMSWSKEISQPISNRLQPVWEESLVCWRRLKMWVRYLSSLRRVPIEPIITIFLHMYRAVTQAFLQVLGKFCRYFFGVLDFFDEEVSISQTLTASELWKKFKARRTLYKKWFNKKFWAVNISVATAV